MKSVQKKHSVSLKNVEGLFSKNKEMYLGRLFNRFVNDFWANTGMRSLFSVTLALCGVCVQLSFGGLFADAELLKKKDISRIMQQIFQQHVEKKEISESILKSAFHVYVDQFDPERIYLLENELQPFFTMDPFKLNLVMDEYKKDNFEAFEKLNEVVQKSIFRARDLRARIEKNKAQLFDGAPQKIGNYNEMSDPDLKVPFASNLSQLEERIKRHIVRFIDAEKKRYGDKKIIDYQTETLEIYNKHLMTFENQYLYVDSAANPLQLPQKENLFTFHVLKALASSLDAHTTVLNPSEAYDMRVRLEKGFQGIGVGLKQSSDGSLLVTSLVEGGPAAKSRQIQVGDRLIQVNGTNIDKTPLEKVMVMLRGNLGSTVKLVFLRTSKDGKTETISVDLKREEIAVSENRVETTYEKFDDGIIGKITLHSFYQGANGVSSENDVQKALQDLSKKGPIKGLILDLRENSGGFLTQAVKVAGLFITNGVIVVSKYSNGEEHFYRDMNNKVSYSGPLIILTSKATASAAEIVAQALQDYGVALVVGDEHTYGKGTIQSQTVTDDKSTSYFKVTVGVYYTVSGKTPQIQGVKADIVVPSPFLDEHIGEEYLEYSLKSDTIPPSFNDQLADVDPNLKAWYLHYYAPTLQHHTEKWRDMIATLKQNANNRLNKNVLYKQFLATEHSNDPNADKIRKKYWVEDVQMQEAVNIIKDMTAIERTISNSANTADSRVGRPVEN